MGMTFTAEDEPDLTLPEDSMHRGRLLEIKPRTFTFTDRKTGAEKEGTTLEWWWEIVRSPLGPNYLGRRVKGECNPKLSNRPDNKFRIWSEALLHREVPVGMSIDIDDLVGMEADIIIGHRQDRQNKDKFWEYVSDVGPADNVQDDDPPF